MQLVEQHIIKKNDNRYKFLDDVCFKSKSLYNAALYTVRHHYFETKQFLNYFEIDKNLKKNIKLIIIIFPVKFLNKH